MRRQIEKLEIYYENTEWARKCYRFKVLQVFYQGIVTIALGASVVTNPGECSSPIQVFLVGLFGLYLSGSIINFGLGFSRYCQIYIMTGIYKATIGGIVKGFDSCYIPIYVTFSVFEFIWYIVGSVWYFQDNDCLSEYTNGANLAIALLAIWYTFMGITLVFLIGINIYLRSTEITRNPPKEQVKSAEPPKVPQNQEYYPGNRPPYWAQENTYPQTPVNLSYYDRGQNDPRIFENNPAEMRRNYDYPLDYQRDQYGDRSYPSQYDREDYNRQSNNQEYEVSYPQDPRLRNTSQSYNQDYRENQMPQYDSQSRSQPPEYYQPNPDPRYNNGRYGQR